MPPSHPEDSVLPLVQQLQQQQRQQHVGERVAHCLDGGHEVSGDDVMHCVQCGSLLLLEHLHHPQLRCPVLDVDPCLVVQGLAQRQGVLH